MFICNDNLNSKMDKFLKRKHDPNTDNASTNTSNIGDDTLNNQNKIKKVSYKTLLQ